MQAATLYGSVGEGVNGMVGVGVTVGVGVIEGVNGMVGVGVTLAVCVAVALGVMVGVEDGVDVDVGGGVKVAVYVGVYVGIEAATNAPPENMPNDPWINIPSPITPRVITEVLFFFFLFLTPLSRLVPKKLMKVMS